MEVPLGVHMYQYIDDILVGGDNKEQVGQGADAIRNLLVKNGLDVPSSKCQGPGQEITFLGAWWIAGAVAVRADTRSAIEKGQTAGNKTELQQLLGTLGYWRKHIPGFSLIVCPLCDLLEKNRRWNWTLQHMEALNTLKDELKAYQRLGPLHPRGPLRVEWGFTEHASYCGVFQKGPQGPARPLLFSSTSFKDTER